MSSWNILRYEVLDSTNLEAGRRVEAEDIVTDVDVLQNAPFNKAPSSRMGTVILASRQTAGRGRRGRSWNSPAGKNLYFSLILRPAIRAEEASALTLVMGLAVAESIRSLTGVDARIKWPNDIVAGGRKVCGILAEMVLEGRVLKAVIMGVGINVGCQQFAEELAATATSLEEVCGRELSTEELLEDILQRFETHYEVYCEERKLYSLKEPYNHLLANLDRQVRVLEPEHHYEGVARGINERGELLVELPDGTVNAVYAGEVSVRGIYGYV